MGTLRIVWLAARVLAGRQGRLWADREGTHHSSTGHWPEISQIGRLWTVANKVISKKVILTRNVEYRWNINNKIGKKPNALAFPRMQWETNFESVCLQM